MIQPQPITFFIDRCLGNRCIAQTLRNSGVTVKIHDEYFSKGAEDVAWLPEVGKRGWVVLTKDGRISSNLLERIAVARAHIKMFIFASQSVSGADMSAILLKAIVPMQVFVREHPAPFIAKIYRDSRIAIWKDQKMLLEELKRFS